MKKVMRIENLLERLLVIIFLIVVFPVLVILMIIIRMESKGSPLFKQCRVGKEGKFFTIYKLRTMKIGKEPIHIDSSFELEKHEHYRVTSIGKFLRLYNIDEIPQLWNIIKNEMSFVGPRPLISSLIGKNYYAPIDEKILPGLTGLVQTSPVKKIKGYNLSHLDKFYCKKKNLQLDLFIIFLTLKFILFKKSNIPV
jgi:O-antigen biosynthesis protein WbqP